MAKEVEAKKTQPVANLDLNYYERYGTQSAQSSIRGKLLKFSKGDWLAGRDEVEMEEGTRLVAVMTQLLIGWQKWMDNKPEQQIMGLLSEGFQVPPRDALGDMDQSQWEVWGDSRPRDPWQATNLLLMKEVGKTIEDDDNLYTFTASSQGGITCVMNLAGVYGKHMRTHPNQLPIVELGVGSYIHAQFGRVKVPKLDVVDWEDAETLPF